MLHKGAWVATLLGTHLGIQGYKKVKFPWQDISSLAVKGLKQNYSPSFFFKVRVGVLNHLYDFISLLPDDWQKEYLQLFNEFRVTDNMRNWRFRGDLAQYAELLFILFLVFFINFLEKRNRVM